jgi:alkanesulfonate monooxygenase SsuD/methylene tetrahydromethanopterin reductase-like flavin-dependent oxidoreductase (luciferase family)
MADGWIGAGSVSTDDFRTAYGSLQEALAAEGRHAASFDVAKRVYVALDDDRDRARARLDDWFGLFYGRGEMADRVAVFGPAEACVEGLSAVIDAGARMIVVNPVFDQDRQAEALAAEVLPALRDR